MDENSLFPVVDVPEFVDESSEYDTQYKRSMKWDPSIGDFIRDGSNRVVECDGKEAFAIWCYKAAQTERYQCLAYPEEHGSEMEEATKDDDEKTVESMVQRTITEAIKVNPRTEYVGDFSFEWNGDDMTCQFVVKGIEWDEEITITV